jgi:hypothetical protein
VTGKIKAGEGIDIDVPYTKYAFEFSVTESFRGFAFAGQKINIYTGESGGGCGYPFKVGATYLVYATRNDFKLVTSICTPTRLAAEAPHIIRQLRALQNHERVADLFGMVGTSPFSFTDDLHDIKPLAGKQVRVIGSSNFEHTTTTDDEGVFSFKDLPADIYRIEVDPPFGMSTWQLNSGEKNKVDIGARGASGCRVNITFSADGRIKGKVIDEEGNGLAGFVTVEPADEKEAEAAKWRGGLMGYTTDTGDFELWLLPPGQYRLVFHPKINGRVDFGVPAVKSEVITIGLGEHFEDFRFKVQAVRP